MRESTYQSYLIGTLKEMFPGCVILKNDSGYLQGIPDLTIFVGNRWALLEVKPSEDAAEQPNQRYYVELLDEMSYAAFIFPENEEEVLHDLQQIFSPRRQARVPKS
jgi:hypothetical protein